MVKIAAQMAEPAFDLTKYPTEYLECREAMRHRLPANADWRWSVLKNTRGKILEYKRTTQCLSCQALITDVTYADGTKKRTVLRPTLPMAYRIPRAAGVSVYDLRLELMSRFQTQAEVITE
jgi:hypothetical protein